MKVGDKIRRKNHKNKTRKNNHEILTITGFSKSHGFEWVELKDSKGKLFTMNRKGLESHEVV